MKGQLLAHMILLGIGALLIAGMALAVNAVREEHSAELARLQASQICGRIRLAAQDMWSQATHATGQTFQTATRSLDFPARIGGQPYVIMLSDSTVSIDTDTSAHTCSLGVPALGSGTGTANVQLVWSRSGSQDTMEIRSV